MGKGNSKLKRKNRAQSMAWNFRFPSMTSLSMRRKGTNIGIHMSIKQWLTILNLNQYEILFESFKGVEDVMRYTDEDLSDLGVKNEVHRTKMAKSLVALKNKYEQRLNKTGAIPTDLSACHSSTSAGGSGCDKTIQRHSVAVDPTTLINHCPTESDILVIKNFNQSKSLSNIKMEAVTPDPDMDAMQLKKMLEWELSLDTRDLRSHAWYHGAIPRSRAEEIVSENDGDFLVRDCTSQPGNYVLSCRSKNQNLHFVINKIVLQPDTVYERVQYRFEEDGYDTVPDLITYYVGSGKPITTVSGAKIQSPRNRLYPLSFYANKYELHQQYTLNYNNNNNNRCSSPLSSSGPSPPNSAVAGNLLLQQHNQNRSSFRSPVNSPPQTRREKFYCTNSVCSQSEMVGTTHKLPSKKHRSLSLSPWESQSVSDDNNRNGEIGENHSLKHCNSLPRQSFCSKLQTVVPNTGNNVTTTMPRNKQHSAAANGGRLTTTTRTVGNELSMEKSAVPNGITKSNDSIEEPFPPPKPSRVSSYINSVNYKQDHNSSAVVTSSCRKNSLYHTSGSDSGNGSGDSMSINTETTDCVTPVSTLRRSSAGCGISSGGGGGVVIKNPKYFCQQGSVSAIGSLTTLKAAYSYDTVFEDDDINNSSNGVAVPFEFRLPSLFDLDSFHTLLLPMAENKPLDSSALQGIRMLLQDSGSRILANHLTRTDIELTLNDKYYPKANEENYKTVCYCGCGIELCVLPHGHQIRSDLIERTNCMKLLVAVTILTCTSDSERAEMLNKWISVAIDTKTALGNLFGFCSIMLGLCMPQVERLASTWHIMRQKFTDSAFNFEAKLRPTLKSMNEGTNPLAPNTTIPHLMPAMLLYEQTFDDIVVGHAMTTITEERNNMIRCWENSSSDLGLSALHTHLENARQYCQSLPTFKRNSEIVLSDSKIDDLLLDMFRAEFHLKFLWGSRGASVSSSERYSKFEQVLNVMSEKCESSATDLCVDAACLLSPQSESKSVVQSTAV